MKDVMDQAFVTTPKGSKLPLLSLKGKLYLTVPYRVMWFREDYPHGKIETIEVERTVTHAIYKAVISIPWDREYRILGQGTKSESKNDFPDYIEKAETSAIGRALAICGYGTQFALELDEEHRIVDAPISTAVGLGHPQSNPSIVVKPGFFQTGKYKGKSFEEIFSTDRLGAISYKRWLMEQVEHPSANQKEFIEFIDQKQFELLSNNPLQKA